MSAASTVSTTNSVSLIGLDFGSTTSHALIAQASIVKNSVTGRMELRHGDTLYRSPIIFTPYETDQTIDIEGLRSHLVSWIADAGLQSAELFGGGAIVTGLAALSENASRIAQLVRHSVGECLFATASDPHLESWLAFRGSCDQLCQNKPEKRLLNLDIGGGTSNWALGSAAGIELTGCAFIGARHFQFTPGTYRLAHLSSFARNLLAAIGSDKAINDTLSNTEREAILDIYVACLEAIVAGEGVCKYDTLFDMSGTKPSATEPFHIVFSGGVGELIYAHRRGDQLPQTTAFGDLGIDLARRIVASPILSRDLDQTIPHNQGRATVYGLALHHVEISGTSLFLPDPRTLPLQDLPVFGTVRANDSDAHLLMLLRLVSRAKAGGSIIVETASTGGDVVAIGKRLARIIKILSFPPDQALALFVRGNVGKALGHYATDWGRLAIRLVVIDEIEPQDAQFATIGSLRGQVVPVSFYGIKPRKVEDRPT